MSIGITSSVVPSPQNWPGGPASLDARLQAVVAAPPPQALDALTTFSAAIAVGLPLNAILAAQVGAAPLIQAPAPSRALRVQPVEKSERS